jgi:DNA polymerase III subunit alpha
MSNIFKKTIVGPHNHPLSLDSGNTVKQFIRAAAKDFGRTAIAITDHGLMGAIIEAHDYTKELKKKENLDITVIPGVELYLLPSPDDDSGGSYYHVTVHFQDFEAYLDACKLSKAASDRAIFKGGELKPLTTWEELESLSGKVTLFSSCLVGAVQRPWMLNRKDISEKNFLRLMRIAGPGRFFAEIFPYEVSKDWNKQTKQFQPIKPLECCTTGKLQVDANNWIMYLAKKHNVPMVISEDAHYAHEEDKFIQDARLNKDGKSGWKMADANCLHHTDWLYNELSRLHPGQINEYRFEEMVENSYQMLSNFKGFEPKFKARLPKVYVNGLEISEDSALVEHTLNLIVKKDRINLRDPAYAARINKEIQQLAFNGKVNLLPYFLALNTIIEWCEENDVLVGPGRGSAAGCLLGYALGITSVDPIIEDLSFERFFDVTRAEEGLADIDTDFSDRTKVVEFIKSHWGDNFAYLGIGTTFKTKSALKDIDRFLFGEVRPETELVCKKIPNSPQGVSEEDFLRGYTDADGNFQTGELETNEDLREYLNENHKAAEYLFKMVGIVRQMGRHAAGVLIADRPVHDFIPIMQVSKEPTTQLLPKWVEKCGGVKYDILGLNTLEDIRLCLKLIRDRKGIKIDPWKIKDDPKFWAAAVKDPVTVFQLHTPTVRDGLRTMRPNRVQEAAILTSVFRPGAMDAQSEEDPTRNMAEIFLECWTGQRLVKMVHPELEPILGPTKGIVVYQEQIMRIVHELGGLSMSETNKLRRSISKKAGDELIKLLQVVEQNLIARGWTEHQAKTIVNQMKASGRYCFNKSHAVSYCYIARACAYLKYHYPTEWWAAVMTNSSKDDLQANWQYISKISSPIDINSSTSEFSIINTEEGEKILVPLSLIEGIGTAIMKELLEKRPFASLEDMMNKIDRSTVHRGAMFKLILGGALDKFFPAEYSDIEKMQEYLNIKSKLDGSKNPDLVPEEYRHLTPLKNYLIKKSVFKVYTEKLLPIALPKLEATKMASRVGENGKSWIVDCPEVYRNKTRSLVSLSRLREYIDSESAHYFAVVAYITKTEEKTFQNTKTRLIVTAEIDNENFDFIKWPEWKKDHHGVTEDIEESVCVLVLSKREGSDSDIFVDSIKVIESLNFLKEKKENAEQKPKPKRTKRKVSTSNADSGNES